MIRVNRLEKPSILVQNAISWTENYLIAKSNYEQNKTPENKNIFEKAEKKYNHETVKTALKSMFHNKCAFCESNITQVYAGDIEHFRPKSKFPEFCFEWENLLFACSVCNGKSNKGDKFPLENEGGFLIDPTEENPSDFFRFEFDQVTKLFLLIPINERGETMLKTVKLNREDLAEFRTTQLMIIVNLISKIEITDEIITEFSTFFSEKDQYFAFIKTIIEKVKSKI
ncbi:hypothetical protein [Flavobacterium sp.]|uniref:hypothetical protein n=1 Tax=Flavobacterium sp. TaxID=239 RepID=UPI00286B052A|nr:hypothetical protein [Flavobacterium sp.]